MSRMLPVSKDYLAGYLDGAASIQFEIAKSSRAVEYRITPELIISVYDRMTYGMLDECFEVLGVNYRSEERENTWQLMVESRDSMEKITSAFCGESIRNNQAFHFLQDVFWPAEDERETLSQNGFYQMVVAIERLQTHRRERSVKYTREFFQDVFDINSHSLPLLDIPDPSSYPTVTPEYFAGFFDGAGRFSPAVQRSDIYNLGYSLGIHARIQRGRMSDSCREPITQFLEQKDISFVIQTHEDQRDLLDLQITSRESLEQLLEIVSNHLVGKFDDAMQVSQQVLTRLEAEEHLTKEGFVETLAIMDDIVDGQARRGKDRTLTASYFRELWAEEIADN